ncbi:MAG: gliding motility protein GldC [Cytophagaceae bacterium]|nr:gliding motility protein GldC [Cytophagaceae bacterium]MDW8455555.1 gliding motility protein GldC [Cytophagaceae bacterium]
MKKSDIKFEIELDAENIPEKIKWHATDGPYKDMQEANAVSISVWDPQQLNTMRIDLWNKEMNVYDMKRYCIEMMDGISQLVEDATNDKQMADEIRQLCSKLVKHVQSTSQ